MIYTMFLLGGQLKETMLNYYPQMKSDKPPYTLDSTSRFEYQKPQLHGNLKNNTSRYGCNTWRHVPAIGAGAYQRDLTSKSESCVSYDPPKKTYFICQSNHSHLQFFIMVYNVMSLKSFAVPNISHRTPVFQRNSSTIYSDEFTDKSENVSFLYSFSFSCLFGGFLCAHKL